MAIIRSMIESDFYKMTMQAVACKLFSREIARYDFINRDKTPFPEGFAEKLRREIEGMADLALRPEEKFFLANCAPFLDPVYLDFLAGYKFDPKEVEIVQDGGALKVSVTGPWYRTILWETPILAIISELYYQMTGQGHLQDNRRLTDLNRAKAETLANCGIHYADFGMRRRFSGQNHDRVIMEHKQFAGKNFTGTSCPYYAMKYGLPPIGTQAHEMYMLMAAMYGFRMANTIAMDKWVEVYQGSLGIALTDTFTTDAFFKSFTMKYAKLFDGVRQDSGKPMEFAEKAIKHYEMLRIDPMSKTIVFSDSLNITKAIGIHEFCKGRVKDSYGIGTHLTNDIPGVKPLNIVMKLTGWLNGEEWVSTVKLSDDCGKHTGDQRMIDLCKGMLNIN